MHLLGERRPADAAADLQRQPADSADARPRDHLPRDDSRRSHHPAGRTAASPAEHPPACRRLTRSLGGRYAGRGHDQLHRQDELQGPPRSTRQDIFASEALHVVERFTRSIANRIRYQFTVDDPATWTSRWSGRSPAPPVRRPAVRVRLPRGKLRAPEHPPRRPRARSVARHHVQRRDHRTTYNAETAEFAEHPSRRSEPAGGLTIGNPGGRPVRHDRTHRPQPRRWGSRCDARRDLRGGPDVIARVRPGVTDHPLSPTDRREQGGGRCVRPPTGLPIVRPPAGSHSAE